MMPALRAELRKLFSVRSTYVILILAFLITAFFAFYATGWKAKPDQLSDPTLIANQVGAAIEPLSLFFGLVAILLVTHEYRYNTIVYTLTANKSRTKILLAKFFAITLFSIVASAVFGALSPLLTVAGIHAHSLHLGSQNFPAWSLAWRGIFAGWAFTALSFILAVIIRIQVGAIVAMFLVPSTIENLLGLLLKKNQIYLPFTAVNSIIVTGGNSLGHITHLRALEVASIYIVVGLTISWLLFMRRDAN